MSSLQNPSPISNLYALNLFYPLYMKPVGVSIGVSHGLKVDQKCDYFMRQLYYLLQ